MQPRPSGSGSRPSQKLESVLTRTGKVFARFARVARFPCSSKGMMGKSVDGEAKPASKHPLFQLSIISNTTPRNTALHQEPPPRTPFLGLFGVPVTSFVQLRYRKLTTPVRVHATSKNKSWLLATFCSRILLIWQSTSVIFRNSQLFWGSERLAVLNFHTLNTQGSPSSAHHFWALFRGPRHKFYAAAWPKGYRIGKGLCTP
jgi:hypothetical protein